MREGVPFFLSRRTIFWPVSSLMLGTASLSRIVTPIWEGDIPFLAIVTISSEIDLGVCATHLGDLLLKGVTVELIPFPLPLHCILPITTTIIFNIIKNHLFRPNLSSSSQPTQPPPNTRRTDHCSLPTVPSSYSTSSHSLLSHTLLATIPPNWLPNCSLIIILNGRLLPLRSFSRFLISTSIPCTRILLALAQSLSRPVASSTWQQEFYSTSLGKRDGSMRWMGMPEQTEWRRQASSQMFLWWVSRKSMLDMVESSPGPSSGRNRECLKELETSSSRQWLHSMKQIPALAACSPATSLPLSRIDANWKYIAFLSSLPILTRPSSSSYPFPLASMMSSQTIPTPTAACSSRQRQAETLSRWLSRIALKSVATLRTSAKRERQCFCSMACSLSRTQPHRFLSSSSVASRRQVRACIWYYSQWQTGCQFQPKSVVKILLAMRLNCSSFCSNQKAVKETNSWWKGPFRLSPNTLLALRQYVKVLWFITAKLRMCGAFLHSTYIILKAVSTNYSLERAGLKQSRLCRHFWTTMSLESNASRMMLSLFSEEKERATRRGGPEADWQQELMLLWSSLMMSYWKISSMDLRSALKTTSSSSWKVVRLGNFSTSLKRSTAWLGVSRKWMSELQRGIRLDTQSLACWASRGSDSSICSRWLTLMRSSLIRALNFQISLLRISTLKVLTFCLTSDDWQSGVGVLASWQYGLGANMN